MLHYTVGACIVDNDRMNAELLFDGQQWGEIRLSDDKKSIKIIIYPDAEKSLSFDYNRFLICIEQAKQRLLSFEPLES